MKTIIVYKNMLFASPGHLMNHFRVNKQHQDITTKYLTQCVYKKINVVKGTHLSYLSYDLTQPMVKNVYDRIKSLTRSGQGFIMGSMTPLDYFHEVIKPLITDTKDPIEDAIERAIHKGIGTRKDYDELLKSYKKQ